MAQSELCEAERTGIDYSDSATPFIDRFGHFCVHFAHQQLGLGRIGLRANPFIYRLLEPAACLELQCADGRWFTVRRLGLQSLPWMTIETARVGALEISCHHVFATGARLLTKVVFRNMGSESLPVRPRWRGFLPAHQATAEQWLAPFGGLKPEHLATWFQSTEGGCRAGWRSLQDSSSYPQPSFGLEVSGLSVKTGVWEETLQGAREWRGEALERCAAFAIESVEPLVVPVGQERSVFLSFSLAWQRLPENEGPIVEEEFEKACRNSRSAYLAEIDAEHAPKSDCPVLSQHLWRARHALLRTGFQSDEGEFRGRKASLCTSDDQFFSTVFFWDSLFSAAAISSFNPAFARDAIFTAFTRQDPRDGSCPENKWNFTVPQRIMRQYPQAPVGSWAARHYLQQNPGDDTFLQEIYPVLLANHRFWDEYGDADGDGLAEWRWSGQTADDSPLYDPFIPGGKMNGCHWLPPIASVQLNCFLYKDAGLLRDFAATLRRKEDVDYFEKRRERIQQKLMEICWVPEDRRFWDFSHATRSHTKVPTFYMFWPLFAGLPLDNAVVTELLETELLNPEKFFGGIPFPSVAYDHPKFDPSGYWRGKAWPHICYWLLETLMRHGRPDQAEEAGQRLIAWMTSKNGFLENMESDPRLIESTGHIDYNWGIASFLLIASKRYLEFVP